MVELRHTRIERFYQQLLDLRNVGIEPHLEEALDLFVEVSNVDVAYLVFFDDEDNPVFQRARGGDVDEIGGRVSRCIMRKTIVERTTVITPAELDGAQGHAIRWVLCAAIDCIGALYVESRTAFDDPERRRAECFARELAVVSHRLKPGPTLAASVGPVRLQRMRDALVRHDWNVGAAAAELAVARTTLYRALHAIRKSGV
jgi:hypothetical protein